MPAAPQALALQALQLLHVPACQPGLGQALVSHAAGLLDWSQGVPPQAGGVQVTERLLLLLQTEPPQVLHWPHAPVSQTPFLASPPVQDCDDAPAQSRPPHAGVGLLHVLVRVPPVLQAVAEQWDHADQPPSTGVFPVQVRDEGPEQLLPPHPGSGLSQFRVCVPLAPQAVAEQLDQADQPPSTGELPAQPRTSLVPLLPSSFRHSWPPCAGAGLLQVRVRVPLVAQAVVEQALQSDQPPSTAVYFTHFSESAPPYWPSQRQT